MAKNPRRCVAKAAEKSSARVNEAVHESSQPRSAYDVLSAASLTLPAAPVDADARGESPRANDDGSQMELIYSGESNGGSKSKKTPRSPESTGRPSMSLRIGIDQVVRPMVITRVCLVWRMSVLTHSPRLLLRIRRLANATMTCAIVMATLGVPRTSLVPPRKL